MDPEPIKIEITDEQFKALQNSVSYLQETMAEIDYCLMLRENIFEAFEDFKTNGIGISNNFIRLNRYLMNWLNSFYAWIEYHEKNYKPLFSTMSKKYHDTNFSYRFAYGMRRYTTHQSLCISRISFDSLNETTKFIIPIDEILLHGKKLNKKLLAELEQMKNESAEIDLESFTKDFLTMFESFQSELWNSIISKAEKMFSEITELIKPYLDKPITGCRIKNDNIVVLDVGVVLTRYIEKRKLLSVPDYLKPYLK